MSQNEYKLNRYYEFHATSDEFTQMKENSTTNVSVVFVPLKGTPTWQVFTKLYKFGYNAFPNISHMKYRTDPILGKAFCISLVVFFHFPDSGLSVLTGLHLPYIDGVTVKTETQQSILVTHRQ